MSHGPGKIERKIAALFAASKPYIWPDPKTGGDGRPGADRTFTVDELAAEVFGDGKPTLAQRGSVLRAAHRAIERADAKNKYSGLGFQASPLSGRRIVFHHYSRPVRVWAVATR